AVLLDPGNVVWIDVVLPRSDARWTDDVRRAPLWLGARWASAIGGDAHVHEGAMVTNAWSSIVCFAGRAAGEVTAGAGGPKLVGISQRRTRAGAWFQCVA